MTKDRDAANQYAREWSRANWDKVSAARIARVKARQKMVNDLKATQGCITCGMTDPRCIHYHHRDPATKKHDIGTMVGDAMSVDRILKEIEKCDPMCANCHFILHDDEREARELETLARLEQT